MAEYLRGDLPLKMLPALIVLAPAYGGGAILIREAARRTGRGWPTMLLLGTSSRKGFLGDAVLFVLRDLQL